MPLHFKGLSYKADSVLRCVMLFVIIVIMMMMILINYVNTLMIRTSIRRAMSSLTNESEAP